MQANHKSVNGLVYLNLIKNASLHRVGLNILGSIAEAGETPTNLSSHSNFNIQVLSKLPSKTGITLEGTTNKNDIKIILVQDLLSQVSVVDHTNSSNKQLITNSLLDSSSVRDLESRTGGNLLSNVHTTGTDIDKIDSALSSKRTSELNRVLKLPALLSREAVLKPVGGRHTQEDGNIVTDSVTGQLSDFQGQTNAVLEATTVVIGALVGGGAKERREEVSVSVVDLDEITTSSDGTLNSRNPGSLDLSDIILGHGDGDRITLGEGNGAGSLDIISPTADRVVRDNAAKPRWYGRCLAAGVCELDTDFLALAVRKLNDLFQGRDLRVLPETHAAGGDAALGDNTGCFDDNVSRSALGNGAVVSHVPGGHVAIIGTVLAHGRHL